MDIRNLKDRIASRVMFTLCMAVVGLAFLMAFGLFLKARPVLSLRGIFDVLFSVTWHPTQGHFGLASFIMGTLWVTGIAMLFAVPLSICTAVYISEYAHRRTRTLIRPVIDVLAGVSPVIYGVWGVIAIVPIVRDHLMPFFSSRFPFFPFASDNYTGYSALSAGIVLAVMVSPVIISVTESVIREVPLGVREASLALGATKWQTVKHAVLKKAWPGIIAAVMLGLARAFGETIAVLMVAGCALGFVTKSIFDPAYPLPALIANTYGEMMSVPLYDAAIMLAAFILLAVTAAFNMVGWRILLRIEKEGFSDG